MPRGAERDPARLGRITIAIILISATAVIALPTVEDRSRSEFFLVAPPGTDLHGLSDASKVLAGGIEVGRVRDIEPLPSAAAGSDDTLLHDPGQGVRLVLAIDRDVELYHGAKGSIVRNVVSGLSTVSIVSFGDQAAGNRPLSDRTLEWLPVEDEFSKLFSSSWKQPFGWVGGSLEEIEPEWTRFKESASGMYGNLLETWPALRDRIVAVADRYGQMGQCLEEIIEDLKGVRDGFGLVMAENGPLVARIDRDAEELERQFESIRQRTVGPGGDINSMFQGSLERIASALHASWMRLLGLELPRNWREFAADSALIGGQVARLFREVVVTAITSIGNDGASLQARDRLDRLGQDLLLALEQVRATETWLRSVIALGGLPGEPSPALIEALRSIDELIEQAGRIERAYRDLRLEGRSGP